MKILAIFNFDFSETYSLRVSFWCIERRGVDGVRPSGVRGLMNKKTTVGANPLAHINYQS